MTDPDRFSLAIAQLDLPAGEVQQNMASMVKAATYAATMKADLLVYPKLAPTGFVTDASMKDLAEPVEGMYFDQLSDIAGQFNMAVCYGYPERDGDHIYSSAALLGKDGNLIANHRQTHLRSASPVQSFSAGNQVVTLAELNGFKIAILVGYEVEFPELMRKCAMAGAEIAAVPSSVFQTQDCATYILAINDARAAENNMFIAYANHAANDEPGGFNGHSMICGPRGRRLAQAGEGTTILTAEVNKQVIIKDRELAPYLQDLRTEIL